MQHTDDAGIVRVLWDDGSTLGLILGQDPWRRLHPRWDSQHMTATDAEKHYEDGLEGGSS